MEEGVDRPHYTHHAKRVGQDETHVQRRVAVDREIYTKEALAIFTLAVEAYAEQRVEDLRAAAGVEQEEKEEGDVGAELGDETSDRHRASSLVGPLGRLCGRLSEHLCSELKHGDHKEWARRLKDERVGKVDATQQAVDGQEGGHVKLDRANRREKLGVVVRIRNREDNAKTVEHLVETHKDLHLDTKTCDKAAKPHEQPRLWLLLPHLGRLALEVLLRRGEHAVAARVVEGRRRRRERLPPKLEHHQCDKHEHSKEDAALDGNRERRVASVRACRARAALAAAKEANVANRAVGARVAERTA